MSLRIGTFNTQLRSTAMEVLADFDPFTDNTAPQRAKIIANRILNSGFDYDVIALNEVFDEEARGVLVAALQGTFPFFIAKPDEATILDGKFEDSGLMFFSRLPIEGVPKQPGKQFLFTLFKEGAGEDALAAKGAVYVRVMEFVRFKERPYNFIITHLQADGEHEEVRKSQLQQIQELISQAMSQGMIDTEDIFLMGDFNINGDQTNAAELGEWKNRFDGTGFFNTTLHDAWARDQSPAANTAALVDRGLTNTGNRYDYLFHTNHDPLRLVVQHLTIAYNLLDPNTPYVSDHYGLNADLHTDRPNCSPLKALQLKPTPQVNHQEKIEPGRMKWYRFNEPGTYSFEVSGLGSQGGGIKFETFIAADLSNPLSPYKGEQIDFGKEGNFFKFVLPEAPFFIRVFHANRDAGSSYVLTAHRHQGTSQKEAIELLPHAPQPHKMPKDKPVNLDDMSTKFDDGDAMWFSIHTEKTDSGAEQDLRFFVESFTSPVFKLLLLAEDGNNLKVIKEAGPQSGSVEIKFKEAQARKLFLLVKRVDKTFKVTDFKVGWETNLTILHGRNAGLPGHELVLKCADETNPEIGSDDIKVRVRADGKLLLTISNDAIGDFDDGDVKSLEPFVPPIRYVSQVDFEIIEMDDVSEDDIGVISIGNLPKGVTALRDEEVQAAVDDGAYRVYFNRSRWSPKKLA